MDSVEGETKLGIIPTNILIPNFEYAFEDLIYFV